MTTTEHRLGRIGIWSAALRVGSSRTPGAPDSPEESAKRTPEILAAVAELEDLGYGTIWLGASPSPAQVKPVLEATSRITVATGILSIWDHAAEEVAAAHAELNRAHGGRFVLGLGVSHSQATRQYERPYSSMKEYLSALDTAPTPVPAGERMIAALGPKMLELSRDRTAGAHPYLVTVEHTARARTALGPDALLAPELKVVLDDDADRARRTARGYLSRYLPLTNYTNNLLRLGFAEDDFRDGGSDRLIDGVFALGDESAIRARVDEFLAAGADHLAVQAVTDDPFNGIPREEWRRLAKALPLN